MILGGACLLAEAAANVFIETRPTDEKIEDTPSISPEERERRSVFVPMFLNYGNRKLMLCMKHIFVKNEPQPGSPG